MNVHIACNRAHTTTSSPMGVHSILCSLFDFWMSTEIQIVVCTEHYFFGAIDNASGCGSSCDYWWFPIKSLLNQVIVFLFHPVCWRGHVILVSSSDFLACHHSFSQDHNLVSNPIPCLLRNRQSNQAMSLQ